MLKVSRILSAAEDYRMEHTAPDASDAPLYNVTLNNVYPDDFYGPQGLQYYADGQGAMDSRSYAVILSAHKRPNAKIKIYRSVPRGLNPSDLVKQYIKDKAHIQKTGKLPAIISDNCPKNDLIKYGTTERQKASGYYEWLSEQITRLENVESKPITINPGDWVSISREYVVQHGESFREGQTILTKTVLAKELFTNGDSFHEWGYIPS